MINRDGHRYADDATGPAVPWDVFTQPVVEVFIPLLFNDNQAIDGRAGFALLNLGFRPFFLGAAVFSLLAIAAWALVYTAGLEPPLGALTPFQWHAHEMIYGYSIAVIAGFLLTAVRNWTGIQTVQGTPLLLLFVLWGTARLVMLSGATLLPLAAMLDLAFTAGLMAAVASPLLRARLWRQLGILSKLVLIGVANLLFYAGALGYLESGVYWSIYGGLYLVVGLVLTMGRRVIPAFIQGGVGYPVTLYNSKWVDISNLVLFLALFIFEVFVRSTVLASALAGVLFLVNLVRLVGWHTPGIWRKPLLCSLYAAYAFIVAGFFLLFLSGFTGVSRFVAVHGFAYGGIGIITLSMMVRVSLGHTGRNVHQPPPAAFYALLMLTMGAMVRVFLPLLAPVYYLEWIALSQFLWLTAFALLVWILFPILTAPRVDGQPG